MDISMFVSTISLPVWSVIAMPLAGVVVGMLFLTLAILLLGRSPAKRSARTKAVEVKEARPSPVDTGVKLEAAVASVKRYKPVPPVRQQYWYYVSGVSGQFATLREALSASGVNVPDGKPLDWKKLSSDIRSRIRRVSVGDEQSLLGKKHLPDEESLPEQVVSPARKTVDKVEDDPKSVVRKPIGNGAFVTIKRKSR